MENALCTVVVPDYCSWNVNRREMMDVLWYFKIYEEVHYKIKAQNVYNYSLQHYFQ